MATQDDSDVVSPLLELRAGTAAPAEAIGAAVRAVGTARGLHPERATRLRVVVEELVREAREREAVDGDDAVSVVLVQRGFELTVRVLDQRLPVMGSTRQLPSRRLVALGFVDQLHIANDGKAGNVAECSIRLDAEDGVAHPSGEVLDPEVPDAPDALADQVEIRQMEPGDTGPLVQCVYRCYGYSYKDPAFYRPRLVRRALRDGHLRSVVAVLPDGEVVGHCAVMFERLGDPVPEMGKMIVDPRFRGHHLAERMGAMRTEMARRSGDIAGTWAECVANHPASQRAVISGGGAEVGLLIGASPGEVRTEGFANDAEGRRTLVATYTPVDTSTRRVVHLPERHVAFVASLAERLGIEREYATAPNPADGDTSSTTTVSVAAGLAHVRLERVGADLLARIADELDNLIGFELGTVHVDVALADAAAAWAVVELERLGFCFAAWICDFRADGDVVRLQRVGDHPVDVEHVVCARSEGEQVRDHVIAEWHRVRRSAVTTAS